MAANVIMFTGLVYYVAHDVCDLKKKGYEMRSVCLASLCLDVALA